MSIEQHRSVVDGRQTNAQELAFYPAGPGDVLEQLQAHLSQLEDLFSRFEFMVREIGSLIK